MHCRRSVGALIDPAVQCTECKVVCESVSKVVGGYRVQVKGQYGVQRGESAEYTIVVGWYVM